MISNYRYVPQWLLVLGELPTRPIWIGSRPDELRGQHYRRVSLGRRLIGTARLLLKFP